MNTLKEGGSYDHMKQQLHIILKWLLYIILISNCDAISLTICY